MSDPRIEKLADALVNYWLTLPRDRQQNPERYPYRVFVFRPPSFVKKIRRVFSR